jgi:ATP-dependent helicase/nuclease subunit B
MDVRPEELAVTRIETWLRDPYAIYARYILRLRPLDRPNEPIEARARGTALHQAIERFTKTHPLSVPADAAAAFHAMVEEELREAGMTDASMAREGVLARRMAAWFETMEQRRRPGARLLIENEGRYRLDDLGFTVTARADRLEARAGRADIIDFKTGLPPSRKQVEQGLAPQLTLTAAIIARGGFSEVGVIAPGELAYVRLNGGREAGREMVVAEAAESPAWAEAALANLRRRIAYFSDPATPYLSWALPQFINERGGDYDHLARLWEWHVIGEAEGGEGAG